MPQNFANAQELVAVENIRENTVVMRSGALRQIVMVGGVNFSLKSEAEQNLFTASYQSFLNGLNFQAQIVIHSRKINIEKYLALLDGRRAEEPSALLQNQIAEYQEFIRGFVAQNAIMEKTFFVVVPFSPLVLPVKKSMIASLPFFGKKRSAEEKATEQQKDEQAEFKENLAQLTQRVNQVLQGLTAIGLEAVVLDDEQLVELFYNFYNPETVEKQKIPA